MFHAELRWLQTGPTLHIAGELGAHWAERARSLVTTDVLPRGLIVDLTELTNIDATGEQLLKWLASLGAVFIASNVYAMTGCERLGISPIQRRPRRRHGSKQETSSNAPSLLLTPF